MNGNVSREKLTGFPGLAIQLATPRRQSSDKLFYARQRELVLKLKDKWVFDPRIGRVRCRDAFGWDGVSALIGEGKSGDRVGERTSHLEQLSTHNAVSPSNRRRKTNAHSETNTAEKLAHPVASIRRRCLRNR